MGDHEILAMMLGLLGILVLGGFVILSRDLREIMKMGRETHEMARQILKERQR